MYVGQFQGGGGSCSPNFDQGEDVVPKVSLLCFFFSH